MAQWHSTVTKPERRVLRMLDSVLLMLRSVETQICAIRNPIANRANQRARYRNMKGRR